MGADLYINKIYKENHDKCEPHFNKWVAIRNKAQAANNTKKEDEAQKKVEYWYNRMFSKGYFRDSYNSTSLFWQLGLSWWGSGYVSKAGNITVANAVKLLKFIQKTELPTLEKGWCKENHCQGTEQEWMDYFKKKKASFEKFLMTAIDLKEPIRASV